MLLYLPVEEDLSLCQAGNSKCLALKVFPTLTSAVMEEETAVSKGLWGLESNALTEEEWQGSWVATQVAAKWQLTGWGWASVTCCPGIHKTHFRELRKPCTSQMDR